MVRKAWAAVMEELARVPLTLDDPTAESEPPELVAEVARRARELRRYGVRPPDRVLASGCGKGPVLVWNSGQCLGAAE